MEYTKQLEAIRKARMKAKELQLWTQEFVIIPYMTTGYIDVTNEGFLNYQRHPEDFNTFRRLYTGKESVNVVWKDSVYVEQEGDTNNYNIKFRLGEVLLGLLETTDHQNQINTDSNFNDYVSQQINKNYKFRIYPTFKFSDYYQYLLYKIPELSGSTVFRVVNVEEDYIGNELVSYIVEFESLNQSFAQTGSAIQQNINNSTPGSGYLEAVVKGQEWKEGLIQEGKWETLKPGIDYLEFFDKFITADFTRAHNRPIKNVCVKFYGASMPMGITFIGRKIEKNNTKIHPTGLIFGYEWRDSSPSFDLYKAGSIQNNYFMLEASLEVTFTEDVMKTLKEFLNPYRKWDYQGFLTFNPIQVTASNDTDKVNWDPKFGLADWDVGLNNATLQPMTWNGNIGTALNYLAFKGYQNQKVKLHDFFFHNYFLNKQWAFLPYSIKQKATASGWIGNIVKALFGLQGIISNVFTGKIWQIGAANLHNSNLIKGIIPADLLEMNAKLFNGNKIPFNVFDLDKGGDLPSGMFLSAKSQQITLYAELTQTFNKDGNIYSFCDLEQTHFQNGKPIINGKDRLLLEGGELLQRDQNGFTIEGFQIEAIAQCDFSVEFFDINGEMVYQGFFQTEGKWTGNYRNFRTERNLNAFADVEHKLISPPNWPIPADNPLGKPLTSEGGQELLIDEVYNGLVIDQTFQWKVPGSPYQPPSELVRGLAVIVYTTDYNNTVSANNFNNKIIKKTIAEFNITARQLRQYQKIKFETNPQWLIYDYSAPIAKEFLMDKNIEWDITPHIDKIIKGQKVEMEHSPHNDLNSVRTTYFMASNYPDDTDWFVKPKGAYTGYKNLDFQNTWAEIGIEGTEARFNRVKFFIYEENNKIKIDIEMRLRYGRSMFRIDNQNNLKPTNLANVTGPLTYASLKLPTSNKFATLQLKTPTIKLVPKP